MRLNKTALALGLFTSLSAAAAMAEPPVQAGETLQSLSQVKVTTTVNGQPGSLADFVSPEVLALINANPTQTNFVNTASAAPVVDAAATTALSDQSNSSSTPVITDATNTTAADVAQSPASTTATTASTDQTNNSSADVVQQDLSSNNLASTSLAPAGDVTSDTTATTQTVDPNAAPVASTDTTAATSSSYGAASNADAATNGSAAVAPDVAVNTDTSTINNTASATQQATLDLPATSPEAPQVVDPAAAAMPTSDTLTSPDAATPAAQ